MFRIKFLDLAERVSEVFEYSHLMDALQVAKDTQLSDRTHKPAMSDELFDNELGNLITSGFVYAGKKTFEYPEGNFMIMLHRVDDWGVEVPVCPALPMPRQIMEDKHIDFIPIQHYRPSGVPVTPPPVDESRSE